MIYNTEKIECNYKILYMKENIKYMEHRIEKTTPSGIKVSQGHLYDEPIQEEDILSYCYENHLVDENDDTVHKVLVRRAGEEDFVDITEKFDI